MQLVLNTRGLSLKVSKGVFFVSDGVEKRSISADLITSIAVTAPCMLSSAAIELAAEANIPIYFFDEIGDPRSCLRSPYFESLATLRRKQVYFSDSIEGAGWVIKQFDWKTENQIALLEYLVHRKKALANEIQHIINVLRQEKAELKDKIQLPSAAWSASLMGWEGQNARNYWQIVSDALPDQWKFSNRNRRPALDPFNALINYFYGMLYTIVEQALFAAGLDPHLGILHVDEHDRPTLAFDLIEPFRPWIDRLVVEQLMTNKVETGWFEDQKPGIRLNAAGKKHLIPLFNEWMLQHIRWQGRQLSRTAHIYHCAAELAREIDSTMKRPV